ncbi:MAG TPA: hypothetical protein VHC44_01100 [Verrucomicrobiae bacterium]|nr:hypothetical protein [Verrucomicrobiae bacterium]
MEKLLDGIYKVRRDPSSAGFGYSYLLKRKAGNVLLSRLGDGITIGREYRDIQTAGGIRVIFITDYHFGAKICEEIAEKFDAECFCSTIEKQKLKKKGLEKVSAFPFEHHAFSKDLEIVPVPGHTSGGVALLWTNDGARYLFTGDFLYNSGKAGWIAGSKSRRKIEDSLQLIKELGFDFLVGCGDDECGSPYLHLPTKEEKVRFIDGILAALK